MYKKIASNTIAQIFSKIITAIISIFLIGILTKYLPIELYGSYNKIYSYLGIFAFLADLGLYTITIREIGKGKVETEKIIGNVLTLRTLMGGGIWLIAIIIASLLPGYNDTLTLIAIAIVGLFTIISLINSSLLALMQSQMKMEFSLLSLVTGKLVNIALIAYFLIYLFSPIGGSIDIGFLSVFIAGLIGILINTGLNYYYGNSLVKIRYRWDWDYINHIFMISLPYGVALFLSVVYFKVDIMLLSLLESPGKADVSIALYGLPMKIIEVLMVLGGFYLNSLLPTLSEKFLQNKQKEISKILGISLKILLSFGCMIFVLGNLFAVETIRIIATPEYITPLGSIFNSVDAFRIVLGVLLFYFISLCFIYMLIASEKQSLLLWVNLGITLFNIIGNIILIPHYSFVGAAVITLISQILLMGITGMIVLKKIELPKIYILHMFGTLLISGVLFGVFYNVLSNSQLTDIWKICIYAPIFLFFYLGAEYSISKKIIR